MAPRVAAVLLGGVAALALLQARVRVHALDNSLALTPPLGWRSYNAFGGRVTQALLEEMMEAMVDRSRKVDGKAASLVGYVRFGLDGGWEDCGAGVNGSHHTAEGVPLINKVRPPAQTD